MLSSPFYSYKWDDYMLSGSSVMALRFHHFS